MIDKCNRMSEDEIVETIINYVDEDSYGYAIMIDGEWGCGKTYFVNETLRYKLEEHEKSKNRTQEYKQKRIVYLSLYGVKSIDEITKQILMESYLSNTGNAKGFLKKSVKVTRTMFFPLLFDVLKTKGIELDADNVSNTLGELLQIKNCILIFDDLERCNCPINEILGYINTFVEHDGMKVIIVANQKEIGENACLENQELKYLVAAHKNIVFEEKVRFTSDAGQSAKEQEPVELSVIKPRMEKLFGQNELYEKVKEKLVGVTIYYSPDLKDIFTKLINNKSISNRFKELLLEEIPFFEEYMINESHSNLRTFQFFLLKVCCLYEVIEKLDVEVLEVFLKYIIKYCFKICVCYKNGKYESSWDENFAINPYDDPDSWRFRYVEDFLVKGGLDEKRVNRTYRQFVNLYRFEKDRSDELKKVRQLESNWFLSTDDEVEEQLEEIINDLGENKYDIMDYPKIISLLIDLEEVGFSKENMEVAISKMKENMEKEHCIYQFSKECCFDDNDKKRRRKRKIIDELEDIHRKRIQMREAEYVRQILLMDNGWAEELTDYLGRGNLMKVIINHGFLHEMDIEDWATKICNSQSYDLQVFRNCIIELYVKNNFCDFVKGDAERIVKLLDKLENIDKTKFDKIKRMQIKCLVEDFQKAKEVYENGIKGQGYLELNGHWIGLLKR